MTQAATHPGDVLELLENRIDITCVPFSDRGSRLLVFKSPDGSGLYVRLAERLTRIQPGLERYLVRPPYLQDLVLVDGQGQPLDYALTTYPHALEFRTRLGLFTLTFQRADTLAIGLPPGVDAGIQFCVRTQMWQATPQGGSFKAVRNLAYQTNGRVLRHSVGLQEETYRVEFVVEAGRDLGIYLNIRSDPDLAVEPAPFSSTLAAAKQRWQAWFTRVPPVAEPYQAAYYYAWWVMGNNLVSPLGWVKHEAMMPSKVQYVGVWNWDACFHSLAFRHVDPELARGQLRAMLACQLPDGMIPDAVYDDAIVSAIDHPIAATVTKPPIMAWAALKVHQVAPDRAFLEEIYVPLVRWNAWWLNMNDDDADGLAQYSHPYSSGLDDSPLWQYGLPVESPDLNTYLAVQMAALAAIAAILGMEGEAAMWRRHAAAMVTRMIADFWDEEAGLFWATNEQGPIRVVTPFSLYPLWTGRLPRPMVDRLLAHLTNPGEFWGQRVVPSVARSDPHYEPRTMWRGPIWANVNYILIEALRAAGQPEPARELRRRTLELILAQPGMFEYYDPETGEPPATAAAAFGWTAAVFIDLAIEAGRDDPSQSPPG